MNEVTFSSGLVPVYFAPLLPDFIILSCPAYDLPIYRLDFMATIYLNIMIKFWLYHNVLLLFYKLFEQKIEHVGRASLP